MPTLGVQELLIILLIVLIIFGASKLPQLGKGLGEGTRSLTRAAPRKVTRQTRAAERRCRSETHEGFRQSPPMG